MKAKLFGIAVSLTALSGGTALAQTGAGTTPGAAAQTQAAGAVQLATKDDIKAGLPVVDQSGGSVGKIESISATGAIIATGAARVEIPFGSFGKSDKGLVIAMTKAQLEAAAKGG